MVEGIDAGGAPVAVAIENEETGATDTVTRWALRVDEALFRRVAADKRDDGIIQQDRVGYKPRGRLRPEYEMATIGAAITQW